VSSATAGRIDRRLRLVAEPSELRAARDFAEDAAQAFGLSAEQCFQVKLAANEALANAIEHGAPCADGRIGLRVTGESGALVVFVCDGGTFTAPVTDTEELPERGRGLAFIAVLMDEVELRPGDSGTVVRMAKRRAA
jgi:anti-sigma regulatory factor (Ser/Thr protein kinase)